MIFIGRILSWIDVKEKAECVIYCFGINEIINIGLVILSEISNLKAEVEDPAFSSTDEFGNCNELSTSSLRS